MHKITFAPGQVLTPQEIHTLAIAADGLLQRLACYATQLTISDLCYIDRGLAVFQSMLNSPRSQEIQPMTGRPRLDS